MFRDSQWWGWLSKNCLFIWPVKRVALWRRHWWGNKNGNSFFSLLLHCRYSSFIYKGKEYKDSLCLPLPSLSVKSPPACQICILLLFHFFFCSLLPVQICLLLTLSLSNIFLLYLIEKKKMCMYHKITDLYKLKLSSRYGCPTSPLTYSMGTHHCLQ